MISFIYGKSGTGKTEALLAKAEQAAENGHVFLLVPDREAVVTESKAAMRKYAGNIDVVTFARLGNYIFRKYGGLCVDYVTPGAKKLIMRNVMQTLAPALTEYKPHSGMGLYEEMVNLRTVLHQDAVRPSDLQKAADALGSADKLGLKTADLAAVFAAFDKEINSRYEDPDGMLERVYILLQENDFFRDTTVLIDSFTSFSKQQLDILENIMKTAKDVVITLPFLPEDGADAAVHFLEKTNQKLFRIAEKAGYSTVNRDHLRKPLRYHNEEMRFLVENIASSVKNTAVWEKEPKHIRLIRTTNVFSEAEAVALDIAKNIRQGMRYRDIAVVARDSKTYEGILDAVFQKYGIPYFLSGKKDISEKPLIRFVFAALAILDRYYRLSDILTYIKTGFAGLSPDEVSRFENYCIRWNVKGKQLVSDEPFSMHPDGYGKFFTETDVKTVAEIEETRQKIMTPLKAFAATMKTAKTVKEKATVLYDFLTTLQVYEQLEKKTEDAKARGDAALAMETVQLWNAFVATLDQLVLSAGEGEVPLNEFAEMLSMVLLDVDIGRIPTSVDEVTVAGASETLPYPHKAVYVIGASEGSFPKSVGDDGIFSEYEKNKLEKLGVKLTDRLDKRVSEELYFFYRAATVPSEELVITYPHYDLNARESMPSIGVKRILKLFPHLEAQDFECMPKATYVEGKASTFENISLFDGNLKKALLDYYEKEDAYREKLQNRKIPLRADNDRLRPENAEALFGGTLHTSYTRLEKFIKCHFAYFCEYEMKLRDNAPAVFDALNIGTFMHSILENTVQYMASGEDFDIEKKTKEAAAAYLKSVFGENTDRISHRLQSLFTYICNAAEVFAKRIAKEFTVSKFKPVDFELEIGHKSNAVRPVTVKNEQIDVELGGKVDRVDLYEDDDGKKYIRIVDYKTGSKEFSMKNINEGLDLQMLLYLFSIWENGENRYGGEVVPAGVLYEQVKPPRSKAPLAETEDTEAIKIGTSGLLLRDEKILRAMDPDLKGEFIPVKESNLKKEDARTATLSAFEELKQEVTETVLHYAKEMKSGIAYARPMVDTNVCDYCKMRAVCRSRKEPQYEDEEE